MKMNHLDWFSEQNQLIHWILYRLIRRNSININLEQHENEYITRFFIFSELDHVVKLSYKKKTEEERHIINCWRFFASLF